MLRFQLFSTKIIGQGLKTPGLSEDTHPFIPITPDLKWYIPIGLKPYSFWNGTFYTEHFQTRKYIPTHRILNEKEWIATVDLREIKFEVVDVVVHPTRRYYTLEFTRFMRRTSLTEEEIRKFTDLPVERFHYFVTNGGYSHAEIFI